MALQQIIFLVALQDSCWHSRQANMTEALTNDTRQEANTALMEVDKGEQQLQNSLRT